MENPIPEQLIVRYLSREASLQEQEELFNWVAADERNQQLFHEMVVAWNQKYTPDDAFKLAPALDRLNHRIDEFEKAEALHINEEVTQEGISWWKIAASITVFLAAGFGIYRYTQKTTTPQAPAIFYTIAQAQDAQQMVTLPDGTVVTLNAHASLRYPQTFSGATREVYLDGEAFFAVAKDAAHPFKIHTGTVTTQVLGTSFNVRSTPERITVSVATGKVQVGDGSQEHIVLPNDKLVYHIEARQAEKSTANLIKELGWMQRELNFEDLTLSEVAEQLQNAYGIPVVFENVALKKCKVTGHYTRQPLDKVLQALEYSTGLHYALQHNTLRLSGPGCQ